MTLSVTSPSGASPRAAIRLFILALAALVALSLLPLEAAHAASTDGLLVSTSSKLSSATTLHSKTVSGKIYVFTKRTSGVSRVDFYVNDPNRSKRPAVVENSSPFELGGGRGIDTKTLPDGVHIVTAVLKLSKGGSEVTNATFTVRNSAAPAPAPAPAPATPTTPSLAVDELQVSTVSSRANPRALDGSTVSGGVYVFTKTLKDVSRVTFHVDDPARTKSAHQTENSAPFELNGGKAFDTTTLVDGTHSVTAAVTMGNSRTEVVNASFTVANDRTAPAPQPEPVTQTPAPSTPSGDDIVRVDFEKAPLGSYTPSVSRDGFAGAIETDGLNKGTRKTNIVNDPLGKRGKVMDAIIPKEDNSTVAPYLEVLLTPGKVHGWEEARVSYWIQFGKGFDFSKKGGKIGWHLAGTNSLTNEPPKHCDNTGPDDGFSARTMWWGTSNGGVPGSFGLYLYDASKKSECGERMPGNGGDRIFTDGRWYHVEQRVKVNTIGSNGKANADSIVELWVDGKLARRETGRSLRASNKYSINWLRFESYFGGGANNGWGHSKDEHVYFDDLRVWTP